MEIFVLITINRKKFKKFISNKKIKDKISNIANKINVDYKDKNPIFLCVLDGSFMFASQLYNQIKIDSEISFIKIKSYLGTKSNKINDLIGIGCDVENRNVILVEDIIDTGKTIKHIKKKLKCKSLKIATLLSKPEIHRLKVDYVGFEISNEFVVGYGLDFDGLGRNIPDIYCMI